MIWQANYHMQLADLSCHGSGKGLRQAGNGSAIRPEPRKASPAADPHPVRPIEMEL